MATSPGNNFAYTQLTPLENSVPRMMEYQDQRGFQKRQEDREIALLDEQKKQREFERKQQLRDRFLKNIQAYDTGSKTLNEVTGNVIVRAMEEMIPLVELLDNPSVSEREKMKAQLKLQNLQQLPENLKRVTDFYSSQAQMYNEGVANNRLWRDPMFERAFQDGFQNVAVDLDENGLPIVGFIDKNNDGVNDVVGVQPFEEIKNMYSPFQFQPKFDYDALLKDATAKIQPETNQTDDGNVQIKTTGLPKDKATSYARSLFVQADGSPTPEMMSVARERGLNPFDVNDQNSVVNSFVSDMSLRTKSGREETRKDSALDWERERRLAASEKKAEDNPVSLNVVETPPIYKEANRMPAKGYKTVSLTNGPVVNSIVVKGKTITNPRMDSYSVFKNKNGVNQIVAEISYEDTKGASREVFTGGDTAKENTGLRLKTKVVVLTQEDAVKFARKIGFQNTNEMKRAAAVAVSESSKGSQRPKTVTQNGFTYTWNEQTQRYE